MILNSHCINDKSIDSVLRDQVCSASTVNLNKTCYSHGYFSYTSLNQGYVQFKMFIFFIGFYFVVLFQLLYSFIMF